MDNIVPNGGAEPQDPDASTANLPTQPALERLTIMPHGITLHSDPERRKRFLTLQYTLEKVGPGTAKGFEAAVLADLAQAGVVVIPTGSKCEVTPYRRAAGFFNAFVQVPMRVTDGDDAMRQFVEMDTRWAKPKL